MQCLSLDVYISTVIVFNSIALFYLLNPLIVGFCVFRFQCEVKLQKQQLSDSQHLLQSLRVELQVYENIKIEAQKYGTTSLFSF